ncbi:hypothetical protein D9757_001238 [Collybiopsis confluens]|uniref:SET domain-containing protein n=1 Tax=Collybiopsis confluens TaxID=2823264 RepID=A0A8H5I183_9AGAR|nr:hypothetical protein D9757_001238 [Collybiopsis confluens]
MSAVTSLIDWLTGHNGYINPSAKFSPNPTGNSIIAKEPIPADSVIVKTPFSLAITRKSASDSLSRLFPVPRSWNEYQCIATYLSFHHILAESSSLRHYPYAQILPRQMQTGLFFTAEERELFKGTNLYGAIIDREREWMAQWSECRTVIAQSNEEWANAFTWDLYLVSASHISSRAFPSTLLSKNPSLISSSSTEPILLPGFDSLNHARGQPVSWIVTYPEDETNTSEPHLCLVIHIPTPAGSELFNNYGAKPNSELILGYGFSLAENPDDTILLKIGGGAGSTRKCEIGRNSQGADGLWTQVLSLIKLQANPDQGAYTYEDELDAASMLDEMVNGMIEKLPESRRALDPARIRPEVVEMFRSYLEGQQSILDSLLLYVDLKEKAAIEKARLEGVDIVLED